ncbi:MAG: beta-ketoacyl-[acyl-carrier-protein] synthase family protein [Candidatus Rokubacteria bacterium]|nr:beta-ketoacyl-[acyl-carrier-protein] synthase family protein [Candidatus Rokubacteria bacterium]
MKRNAVITGLGIVSPIGVGVDQFWEAAKAGRSGIGRPTLFDASKLPPDCQIVGEVTDFDPRDWMPGHTARMAGRFSQFAVAAAKMARADSRLDTAQLPSDQLKISIGTAMNGQIDLGELTFEAFLRGEDVLPWTCLEYPAHAATSHVAMAAGARGQTATFASACAAGLDAIGWAADEVRVGQATAVFAGATETPLSEYSLMLFRSVGVLCKWQGLPQEASRPFDRLRTGLVLAEGAAILTVEEEEHARARGADIYARILSSASATEGTHLRKVDDTGEAIARAMTMALQRAQLSPGEIDFICAHGNSMEDYDAAETAGIKRVFGRHAWNVPASSLKSMCGQALAASSAMQVVASCLTLRDQIVPPTINYQVPDPACDLDYVPNSSRAARVRTILIHAHSLGGSHVAMILAAPD